MFISEINQIKTLCRLYGIDPARNKGQNFLINKDIIDKIITAAEIDQSDTVLEVGPGLGILTEALVKKAGRVVSVELDQKLFWFLQEKSRRQKNLALINQDILKFRPENFGLTNYQVVANLPYNITSIFLKKFLTAAVKPKAMILMLQKEVAQRICARPGRMSLLAVSVQLYAQPIIFFEVNRENFWPRPAVDSAVIRIGRIKTQKEAAGWLGAVKEEEFWRLVRIGFAAKRKQLQNNLAAGLKVPSLVARGWLILAHLAPTVRAQELSLVDWLRLAKISKIHSK